MSEIKTLRYRNEEIFGDIDVYTINYTLEDGVLTVLRKGTLMESFPTPDAEPEYDEVGRKVLGWTKYQSPFLGLDFHTAILETGFVFIDTNFFSDCKALKKIVLADTIEGIEPDFARNTSLEYYHEDGLLFLGTETNPHYFLMGCEEGFKKRHLIIPEGTVYVQEKAFEDVKSICEVTFPKSLKKIGNDAFKGTSIKELFISDDIKNIEHDIRQHIDPDNNWVHEMIDETDRWYFGFWHTELENISVPYPYYKFYLAFKDEEHVDWWHAFANCTITFRNPDGSVAEVLPPDPNPQFNINVWPEDESSCESQELSSNTYPQPNIDTDSDAVLPS